MTVVVSVGQDAERGETGSDNHGPEQKEIWSHHREPAAGMSRSGVQMFSEKASPSRAEELVPRLDDVAPEGEIASRRREAPEGAFREAGLAEGDSQLFRAVNV